MKSTNYGDNKLTLAAEILSILLAGWIIIYNYIYLNNIYKSAFSSRILQSRIFDSKTFNLETSLLQAI